MKYSLDIFTFLENISCLSHSIVFLYFFALITEEGFLLSPWYSLELCIQMGISFLFSFAFHFSSFHSYSQPSLFYLEKAMAAHSSTLAWKIPRMGEPGRLQSMGSWRFGRGWATSTSLFILPFCISFSWGWSWSLPPVQCQEPPSNVLQALCLSALIPWIYFSLPLYSHRDLI